MQSWRLQIMRICLPSLLRRLEPLLGIEEKWQLQMFSPSRSQENFLLFMFYFLSINTFNSLSLAQVIFTVYRIWGLWLHFFSGLICCLTIVQLPSLLLRNYLSVRQSILKNFFFPVAALKFFLLSYIASMWSA